jgi:hypothetical protein
MNKVKFIRIEWCTYGKHYKPTTEFYNTKTTYFVRRAKFQMLWLTIKPTQKHTKSTMPRGAVKARFNNPMNDTFRALKKVLKGEVVEAAELYTKLLNDYPEL